MNAIQAPIAGLPIVVKAFLDTYTIVFEPTSAFTAIIEQGFEVNATLTMEDICLVDSKTGSCTEISYGKHIEYKNNPVILKWLLQQRLGVGFGPRNIF